MTRNIENEREIYVNGKALNSYNDLDVDSQNMLDRAIDIFEDGNNMVNDSFEFLNYNKFTIKRKLSRFFND